MHVSHVTKYKAEEVSGTETSAVCAGIDRIGLDGTLYDQILDFIFYLGLAPKRFQVSFSTSDLFCCVPLKIPSQRRHVLVYAQLIQIQP